ATGSPLLAGDPHLLYTLPGLWYLARIERPDGVWAGATAPGVPGIMMGRNSAIAGPSRRPAPIPRTCSLRRRPETDWMRRRTGHDRSRPGRRLSTFAASRMSCCTYARPDMGL